MRYLCYRLLLPALVLLFGSSQINAQWVKIAPNILPPIEYQNFAIGAIHYSNGILWAGSFDLWSSSDLGNTWQMHTVGHAIEDICFYDKLNGLIASGDESVVLLTNDGGQTWRRILNNENVHKISFNGSSNIIHALTLRPGIFFSSFDAGNTWISTKLGAASLCFDIAMNKNVYVFSNDDSKSILSGWINISSDFGKSWSGNSTVIDGDTYSISIDSCDTNRLYLANENWIGTDDNFSDIIVTTDAGITWNKTASFPVSQKHFSGTLASSKNAIYAGMIKPDGIMRSTNRGRSWKNIGGPPVGGDSRSIAVVDDKTVFVLDEEGSIWRTTNSGGDSVFSLPLIHLATEDIVTDTVGTSELQIPIKIDSADRPLDADLTIHYNYAGLLTYKGSYSLSNVQFDIPNEEWQGRSKLHISNILPTGGIIGYARFSLLVDTIISPKVWFDSLIITNASAPCEITEFSEGNTATSKITTVSACGVQLLEEFVRNGNLLRIDALRPNPTQAEIELDIYSEHKQDATIEIFDALGVKVLSQEKNFCSGKNSIRIETKSLSAGMYIVRVGDVSQSFVKVE